MNTIENNEEPVYTEQEEALWSSLWHDGYDADKENLIRTFRSIMQVERDRAEEEKDALIDWVNGWGEHVRKTDLLERMKALTNPQDN